MTRSGPIAVLITLIAMGSGCSFGVNASGSGTRFNPIAAGVSRAPVITISQFADLPGPKEYYGPPALTSGQDAIWVIDTIDQDLGRDAVVRINPDGTRTALYFYQQGSTPSLEDVVQGRDGALWMTDYGGQVIVRMTTTGQFKSYSLPSGDPPNCITNGPDGALWFTISSRPRNQIGRITTTGETTFFANGIPVRGQLRDIAAGPDGALWFTQENYPAAIGRITTDGRVTEYRKGLSAGSDPYAITAGPDGAMWFTENTRAAIGRVSSSGAITEYPIAASGNDYTFHPFDITAGPDGALWFTESRQKNHDALIGRITVTGSIRQFSGLLLGAHPLGIVSGPDGNVWFVESGNDRVGRVNLRETYPAASDIR